jgi:hypothetical protein
MAVINWWDVGEWADARGDYQGPPDLMDPSGSDVAGDSASTLGMIASPLGEPPVEFDVRSVFDSRPVNGYDFIYSATSSFLPGSPSTQGIWSVNFIVPNGYRAVPLEWDISFDQPMSGLAAANSQCSLNQNGSAVPNNQAIIIGYGTGDLPLKTFFVCEENSTFGAQGFNLNNGIQAANTVTVNVKVKGNLIAVSDVALPFSIANKRYGT